MSDARHRAALEVLVAKMRDALTPATFKAVEVLASKLIKTKADARADFNVETVREAQMAASELLVSSVVALMTMDKRLTLDSTIADLITAGMIVAVVGNDEDVLSEVVGRRSPH